MQEKVTCPDLYSQLLVAGYEKITAAMTLQKIIEIILTELFTRIQGVSAVIQITTSQNRTCYYGYQQEEGCTYWEPNEHRACPEYIQQLLHTVVQEYPNEQKAAVTCFRNTVYARLLNNGLPAGFVLVSVKPEKKKGITDQTRDLIQAVAGQIGIILNQRRVLEEKFDQEKLSLIDRIISGIIHDMKNPLSGISGFVQLIDQKSVDESIKKYCAIILDSLAQLDTVTREFHGVITGQPLVLHTERIALSSLLEETVDNVTETYSHAGIDITIENGNDVVLDVDREKIIMAFRNILKNAKEAMPDGGRIHINTSNTDTAAQIKISDSGIGMSVSVQENVFKPFVSAGKKYATGLGMTIAHRIITGHNGMISVASFLGKGTVYTIHLPCVKKEVIS